MVLASRTPTRPVPRPSHGAPTQPIPATSATRIHPSAPYQASAQHPSSNTFVCHNEDHDNHHLMFFCPQLYFKGLHNTWLQSGTFEATTLKPDQAEAIILEAIPRHLQQRYKWAYRKKTASIPVGKVFLKRKKQWKSGRSQLSPVLSHICVARHEVIWQRIYEQWFTSHNVFLETYVDNRFVIFPSPASGHPAAPLEALLQADFYGAPIVLEQVGSSEFLGFVIDVGDRAIYYKTPSKIWQIRGPRTAGSLSTLLSGARSRSALATKYAHPVRAVQMALDQLRSIYLSAGYKSADLQHLFHLPATPTRKNSQAPVF